MLRNYFKTMFRNFLKRKVFSLINLFGLATGMAICLLLALYIQSELGYDHFQERADQIYRLALERKYPGRSAFIGQIPRSIGQAVKKEFPEVLESVRLINLDENGTKVLAGEKLFIEKEVMMADSNFFQVFTGNFLQGDINSALQKPGTVVLNETTAKKFFGSAENAMGKPLTIDRKYLITGVCRDWPAKSHFQFNVLMSTSGLTDFNSPEYVYFGPYTYLILNKNASPSTLEAKLPLIVDKYVSGTIEKLFGEPYDKFITEGNGYRYYLQPIKQIHLNSNLDNELKPVGSMRIIILFAAIGAFILFLACVNFINLSTALSVERAKEVGIRKTFGSRKAELIGQFLSESVFFSLASTVLALMFVFLLTPVLNNISGSQLTFTYFLNPLRLLTVLTFSILVGILAGVYPAFVLSSFKPVMVLKGRFKSNRRGLGLRNGLVIFQFAISVILIVCSLVVNRQMQYMLGDELGFKKDHIIRVDGVWQLRNRNPENILIDSRQAFVDEISKIPGVADITESDLPGNDESGGGGTWVALDNNASRTQKIIQVDYHYSNLLGLQLKEGRFFSKELPTDSLAMLMNESAVEDYGLKNPIGARLISKEPYLNSTDGKTQNVFTVIGVVKDFHFQSLRKKIAPLIFLNSNKFGWGSAGIRIKGDHFKTTVAAIEKTWKRFDPKDDFQFSFLDQNIAAQYKSEEAEQKIFTIFSLLAILIACIGLFGVASYASMQRTKEIGIRKVLGAMPGNIIIILSKDFLTLIIISSGIAFPLAWWAMYKWLQNFSYRVTMSWWIFLLAGFLAAMIAMLTISYQAIKAAIANPVKSLKTEG